MNFSKCLKVFMNTLIGTGREQNNYYKKIMKFNKDMMHFVNFSFTATLCLYAITGLNCIRFH